MAQHGKVNWSSFSNLEASERLVLALRHALELLDLVTQPRSVLHTNSRSLDSPSLRPKGKSSRSVDAGSYPASQKASGTRVEHRLLFFVHVYLL